MSKAGTNIGLLGGGYAYVSLRKDGETVRLSLSTGMQQGMDSQVAATMTVGEARKLSDSLLAAIEGASDGS